MTNGKNKLTMIVSWLDHGLIKNYFVQKKRNNSYIGYAVLISPWF